MLAAGGRVHSGATPTTPLSIDRRSPEPRPRAATLLHFVPETEAHVQYLPRNAPLVTGARLEARRATKYGIVGVANVGIDFALFALFVTLGVWYPIAKALSLTAATINGYTWNRRWTFRAGRHQHSMLARYVAVQAACYVLNVALLVFMIESLGWTEIVSQAIALPIIAALSFLLQRLWTFGPRAG